ncbi:ankyrin repeat-containing domain protein [Haematococcus lacustris]
MRNIYKAAEGGDDALLQTLLTAPQPQQGVEGRNLEYRDLGGCTPLIVAAANNNLSCVRLLLEHGAKVDAMSNSDTEGGTAFHYAARKGGDHRLVCKLLYDHGANPFLADRKGRTPLDEAIQAGQPTAKDSDASRFDRIVNRASVLHERAKKEAMQSGWRQFAEDILKQGQLWKGRVDIKSSGFIDTKKTRVMMVVPHHPCPRSHRVPEPSRKRLLVFADNKELQLKISGILHEAICHVGTSSTFLKLAPGIDFIYTDPAKQTPGNSLQLSPVTDRPSGQADLDALVDEITAMPAASISTVDSPGPSTPSKAMVSVMCVFYLSAIETACGGENSFHSLPQS